MSEFEWHVQLLGTPEGIGNGKHRVYEHPNFSLCFDERSCSVDGEKISLTPKEFRLMEVLSSQPNMVCSHETLSLSLWNQFDSGRSDSIKVFIKRLKDKLGATIENPIIENIRGQGYRIVDPNSCVQTNGNVSKGNIIRFPVQVAV